MHQHLFYLTLHSSSIQQWGHSKTMLSVHALHAELLIGKDNSVPIAAWGNAGRPPFEDLLFSALLFLSLTFGFFRVVSNGAVRRTWSAPCRHQIPADRPTVTSGTDATASWSRAGTGRAGGVGGMLQAVRLIHGHGIGAGTGNQCCQLTSWRTTVTTDGQSRRQVSRQVTATETTDGRSSGTGDADEGKGAPFSGRVPLEQSREADSGNVVDVRLDPRAHGLESRNLHHDGRDLLQVLEEFGSGAG